MALLTANDWQQRIGWEVSAALPGGPGQDQTRTALTTALVDQLPKLWQMAAVESGPYGQSGLAVVITYLVTKISAIDIMLGQLSGVTDAMLGRVFRISASQKFRNLFQLKQDAEKRLDLIRQQARSGSNSPLVAQILQQAPVMPGPVVPVVTPDPSQPILPDGVGRIGDPNAPEYAGDPRTCGRTGWRGW